MSVIDKSFAPRGGAPSRRVGVFTQRNQKRQISRCACYEFEDVIVEALEPGAVLIEQPANMPERFLDRVQRQLQRRGLPSGFLNTTHRPLPVDGELDVLFFAPGTPYELLQLEKFSDWRQRAGYAACLIQELWLTELEWSLRDLSHVMNKFDCVYCSVYHTAEALSEKLDTRVEFMPYGVDNDLFNPFAGPRPKLRAVDACAIGAMDPATHEALWDWAEQTGRYYHFSSMNNALCSPSYEVHRKNIAQTLQRSKFFFTFMARRAMSGPRGTQEEFGMRYFEGAAAGAIQIGDMVRSNPGFMANLDWEGAVVEAPFAAPDMPKRIEDIEKDPAWVEATRTRNMVNCLTRHDHLHRWQMVLRAAGLEDSPELTARRQRLEALADSLMSEPAPTQPA